MSNPKKTLGVNYLAQSIPKLEKALADVAPALQSLFEQQQEQGARLSEAVSNIDISAILSPFDPLQMLAPTQIELPVFEHPVLETNEKLEVISTDFRTLLAVAKEQAKLTEAIRGLSSTALETAIQSARDAKEATRIAEVSVSLAKSSMVLAKWSLYVAAATSICGVGVALFIDHKNSIASINLAQEERRFRAEELTVLRSISERMSQKLPQKPVAPKTLRRPQSQ